MEGVVEDGSGKKKKCFIGNTFTKINFVTDVLQRVCLDITERNIVLKFPEQSFIGT